MSDGTDIGAALRALETLLRKLEAEYNMFFAGRLPRPPWETRADVERTARRLDRQVVAGGSVADRFRLQTIQSRYATFVGLWDRELRAREEGRPGPFATRRRAEPAEAHGPAERVVYVTAFSDPMEELDKLQDLYERLTEVRHELGEAEVPFDRFATLIRDQVETLKRRGAPEVAFRVAVRDGKIAFTASGLKGADGT